MFSCIGVAAASTVEDTHMPAVQEHDISTRAVSVPTTFAPASWYGWDTVHYWTATYYTYSSYWFTTSHEFGFNIDVWADAPFHVVFVGQNGTLGTEYATYNSMFGNYRVASFMYPNTPFYMIIYNDSGSTIASNAGYTVYIPQDRD